MWQRKLQNLTKAGKSWSAKVLKVFTVKGNLLGVEESKINVLPTRYYAKFITLLFILK